MHGTCTGAGSPPLGIARQYNNLIIYFGPHTTGLGADVVRLTPVLVLIMYTREFSMRSVSASHVVDIRVLTRRPSPDDPHPVFAKDSPSHAVVVKSSTRSKRCTNVADSETRSDDQSNRHTRISSCILFLRDRINTRLSRLDLITSTRSLRAFYVIEYQRAASRLS